MRRLATLILGILLAAGAALVVGTVAQGSDTYRFDVIFDDARGLIPGQQVKIAGAEAGSINDVVVSSGPAGYRARVEASITGPFRFHTDASCIIRPDGLIAENYLDCDPGTRSKPLLAARDGFPPTVPVTHTSEPVSLLDLFNIFNLPTRERFQVLIDELGITTAGNGDAINAILQRANPTLQSAQRVIAILDRQTSQISTAIDATDQIATVGADHLPAVRAFINQAAGLTRLTSDHRSRLEQGIHRLPAFLAAATPALADLDTVASDGTPLLASLHAAVPSLTQVNHDIVPFTRVAEPALNSVSRAISTAIPDTRAVTPVVAKLSHYLTASAPSTARFSKLVVNLIRHGFSEDFLSVLYYVATALGKYDSNSHMLSSLLIFPDNAGCATYSTTLSTSPDCVAHYVDQAASTPARTRSSAARRGAGAHPSTGSGSGSAATTATTSTVPGGGAAGAGTSTTAGGLVSGLAHLGSTVSNGVSKLLGGSTHTTTTQTSTSPLQSLLNYLVK